MGYNLWGQINLFLPKLLLVFVTAIETLTNTVAQDDFELRTSCLSLLSSWDYEYVLPHCLSVICLIWLQSDCRMREKVVWTIFWDGTLVGSLGSKRFFPFVWPYEGAPWRCMLGRCGWRENIKMSVHACWGESPVLPEMLRLGREGSSLGPGQNEYKPE